MAEQVKPPAAKAHVDSEINLAKTYLGLYKNLYNVPDLSDAGLIRMLMGFRNYLDTQAASTLLFSGSLNTFLTAGFI